MPLDKNFTGSLTESDLKYYPLLIPRVVRNLQERVKFLESKLGGISAPLDVSVGPTGRAWNMVQQNLVQQRNPQDNNTLFIEFGAGVSTVNSGTRNIEFYGMLSANMHGSLISRRYLKLCICSCSCSFS